MLTEQLNELVEQEIELRSSNIKAELSRTKDELIKTTGLLEKQQNENKTLKQKFNQLEAFDTFKSLITDVNFSSILLHFNLKRNSHSIDGMDSEEIPTWFKLLFNYYEDRGKLFSIMDLFNFEYPSWAKEYKMPYDYNEEELKLFINPKYDRYICNGEMFNRNTGFFWRNIKGSQGNTYKILTNNASFSDYIPWQLVLSNPLWKKENMFNMILDALKKKQKDSHYYFAIQNYQKISKEQAKAMAKYLPKSNLYDIHKSFINNNLEIIKENEWLAEQFKDVISDNQFSTFYYLNYPLEMQKNYIKKYKGYEKKLALVDKMKISKQEKIEFLMEIAEKELA